MEALKDIEALIEKHGYRNFIIGLMMLERDLSEEDCQYDYDWWIDSCHHTFLNDILSGEAWKGW